MQALQTIDQSLAQTEIHAVRLDIGLDPIGAPVESVFVYLLSKHDDVVSFIETAVQHLIAETILETPGTADAGVMIHPVTTSIEVQAPTDTTPITVVSLLLVDPTATAEVHVTTGNVLLTDEAPIAVATRLLSGLLPQTDNSATPAETMVHEETIRSLEVVDTVDPEARVFDGENESIFVEHRDDTPIPSDRDPTSTGTTTQQVSSIHNDVDEFEHRLDVQDPAAQSEPSQLVTGSIVGEEAADPSEVLTNEGTVMQTETPPQSEPEQLVTGAFTETQATERSEVQTTSITTEMRDGGVPDDIDETLLRMEQANEPITRSDSIGQPKAILLPITRLTNGAGDIMKPDGTLHNVGAADGVPRGDGVEGFPSTTNWDMTTLRFLYGLQIPKDLSNDIVRLRWESEWRNYLENGEFVDNFTGWTVSSNPGGLWSHSHQAGDGHRFLGCFSVNTNGSTIGGALVIEQAVTIPASAANIFLRMSHKKSSTATTVDATTGITIRILRASDRAVLHTSGTINPSTSWSRYSADVKTAIGTETSLIVEVRFNRTFTTDTLDHFADRVGLHVQVSGEPAETAAQTVKEWSTAQANAAEKPFYTFKHLFEQYTVGEDLNVWGWAKGGTGYAATIANSVAQPDAGARCVNLIKTAADVAGVGSWTLDPKNPIPFTTPIQFWFRVNNIEASGPAFTIRFRGVSDPGIDISFKRLSGTTFDVEHPSNVTIAAGLSNDTWYRAVLSPKDGTSAHIEIFNASGTSQGSSTYTPSGSNVFPATIGRIVLEIARGVLNTAAGDMFIDDILLPFGGFYESPDQLSHHTWTWDELRYRLVLWVEFEQTGATRNSECLVDCCMVEVGVAT